jgi:hypothetical protein
MMEKIVLWDLSMWQENKQIKQKQHSLIDRFWAISAFFHAHNLKLNIEQQIEPCNIIYQWIHEDMRHASWKRRLPSHHLFETCDRYTLPKPCSNFQGIFKVGLGFRSLYERHSHSKLLIQAKPNKQASV